jgi:hypothetical protein
MRGYVQNNGESAKFIAQRRLHPGSRVDFETLLPTFTKKSGFEKSNMGFVKWLREFVFSDDRWGFYNASGTDFKFTKSKKEAAAEKLSEEVPEQVPEPKSVARGAGKKLVRDIGNDVRTQDITPRSIIDLDFAKAKPQIEKCRDRVILKKALTLSKHFSNKEEHMRHLMQRLNEIY